MSIKHCLKEFQRRLVQFRTQDKSRAMTALDDAHDIETQ
jgi:hypothetical protein